MSEADTPIDSTWIAANPLPVHGRGTTKNSRGRVLVIGGSRKVPGATRLTGEAALRVGAGKVQLATVETAAVPLGLMVPEAATIALPEDEQGEIGPADTALRSALEACDTVVIGPGVGTPDGAARLLDIVLDTARDDLTLVVDAMAIGCMRDVGDKVAAFGGRIVLTPHYGEMAVLCGAEEDEIAADPRSFAHDAARTYRAVVALKGSDTVIAASDGTSLHYGGGGTGLATGGSGDVLAGAIAGLLSRGATPLVATGWGVWLHGQSARRMATVSGPIGFLARQLPDEFPHLLPQ
ncbi:NAD(P)H-hydrate dehydratase [Sphingomonas floccifaciens]|uniref:ADP-dependent (S)-NAD(P)H-hydrate dehydratase n=1 Tax=Sphingomonas floccifaciens TaxID=1844115 RepID=A0ABW4N857_9SPHN